MQAKMEKEIRKEEFYKLNKNQQIALLQLLNIQIKFNDREDIIYEKYREYWKLMEKEKSTKEMVEELGLNQDRFKTTDKNVLDALKKAYEFKNKRR